MPLIPAARLRTISINIFTAIGLKPDKAQTIANLLIESNLAGHDSHGVLRLPQYVLSIQSKAIDPDVEIEIVSETPSSAVIDGHSGLGQFIATQAMEVAIAKAKAHTISTVNVYNCNHIGRLADYVMMAADAKMIGLLFLNGHGGDHGVAPWGGTDRRLSTNPFACALPTGKDSPMVIDLTTSIVAGGKNSGVSQSRRAVYRKAGSSTPMVIQAPIPTHTSNIRKVRYSHSATSRVTKATD